MSRVAQGKAYEDLACRYLQQQGLRLLERNFRCRGGELDLIMREREFLVFVEVRSRRSTRYGSAAETVTLRKQRRLARAAALYLQRYRIDAPCRFDIVAIDTSHPEPLLRWIKNAFQTA